MGVAKGNNYSRYSVYSLSCVFRHSYLLVLVCSIFCIFCFCIFLNAVLFLLKISCQMCQAHFIYMSFFLPLGSIPAPPYYSLGLFSLSEQWGHSVTLICNPGDNVLCIHFCLTLFHSWIYPGPVVSAYNTISTCSPWPITQWFHHLCQATLRPHSLGNGERELSFIYMSLCTGNIYTSSPLLSFIVYF